MVATYHLQAPVDGVIYGGKPAMSPSPFHNKLITAPWSVNVSKLSSASFSSAYRLSVFPCTSTSALKICSQHDLGECGVCMPNVLTWNLQASFSCCLPFGAVRVETWSKRRLLWATNVWVDRISLKLQSLSLFLRSPVSDRSWKRIYLAYSYSGSVWNRSPRGKTQKSASKGTKWFMIRRWMCLPNRDCQSKTLVLTTTHWHCSLGATASLWI